MGVLPGTKQIPTPVAKGGAFAIPLLIPVQYSLSFVAILFNVKSWELFEEGNLQGGYDSWANALYLQGFNQEDLEEEKNETQLKEAEDSDSDDNIKRGKQ